PIVITRKRKHQQDEEVIDGIRVYRLTAPFLPPFHLEIHKRFLQPFVNRIGEGVDLFHIHLPLVPDLRLPKPYVLTVHSSLIEDIRHYEQMTWKNRSKAVVTKSYYRMIYQRYLSDAREIITVSGTVAAELEKYYQMNNKRITILPNGVDSEFFKDHGFERQPAVLFAGRLGERKGLPDFIAAAERIHQRFPQVEFWIAGEGPLRLSLETQIQHSPLAKKVKFWGWCNRTQLQELFNRASVFVFPSRYEAAPLTLVEAMASGIPIVATPVGNVPDLLKHQENGMIVPPGEPERLASEVISLLENESLRRAIATNAQSLVEQNLTWKTIARKTLSLYERVLHPGTMQRSRKIVSEVIEE
ncbi:MAG: glycosyltransferase family 1 protein, partial [Calditrichaeota bacterium]